MKLRCDNIINPDDISLLHKKFDADVICPQCNKAWYSPYPKTRKVCPDCYYKITGYEYIV